MTQETKQEYQDELKEKRLAYNRAYRKAHKEQHNMHNRKYYAAHKDDPEFMQHRREVYKRCLDNHPEIKMAKAIRWHKSKKEWYNSLSPEEKREYNHQRYLRRREKALEYSRTHPKKKKQPLNS